MKPSFGANQAFTGQRGHPVPSQERGKLLAVVATFNEAENIQEVIVQTLSQGLPLEVLVVDDDSPDGTGDVAESLSRGDSRVHVLHREMRKGLAAALVAGFGWALARDYDFILNLDGDLSHDPRAIPALLREASRSDLCIGSRYSNGIRVINWAPRRLFLSLAAARYVRLVTGMPFADPTSGFRCFRREALAAVLEAPVLSRGYSFHIECLHRIWRRGGRVTEVPIFYTDRARGATKLNSGIIWEAVFITWRLLWQHRLRHRPAKPSAPWVEVPDASPRTHLHGSTGLRNDAAEDAAAQPGSGSQAL